MDYLTVYAEYQHKLFFMVINLIEIKYVDGKIYYRTLY